MGGTDLGGEGEGERGASRETARWAAIGRKGQNADSPSVESVCFYVMFCVASK